MKREYFLIITTVVILICLYRLSNRENFIEPEVAVKLTAGPGPQDIGISVCPRQRTLEELMAEKDAGTGTGSGSVVWNAYRHQDPEGNDIRALDITSGEPYDIDSEIEEKCKNSADGGDGDACVTEWVNGVDDPWLPRGAMRGTVEKCKQVCAGIPKCGGFVRTGELTPQYMDDNDFDEEDRAFATKIGSNMCGFFAKGTVDRVSADAEPIATTYTKKPMPIYGCMDPGASNYAPLAKFDDGECEIPTPSCESRTIRAKRRGGKSPFSYLWSNGKTGMSINPAQDGTYSVLVTDADGISVSGSDTIGPNKCSADIILEFPDGASGGTGAGTEVPGLLKFVCSDAGLVFSIDDDKLPNDHADHAGYAWKINDKQEENGTDTITVDSAVGGIITVKVTATDTEGKLFINTIKVDPTQACSDGGGGPDPEPEPEPEPEGEGDDGSGSGNGGTGLLYREGMIQFKCNEDTMDFGVTDMVTEMQNEIATPFKYEWKINNTIAGKQETLTVLNNSLSDLYTVKLTITDVDFGRGFYETREIDPTQECSIGTGAGTGGGGGGECTVAIQASGGTGSYTYNVDGGIWVPNPSFTHLSIGSTYIFKVKDSDGVEGEVTRTLTDGAACTVPLEIELPGTETSCGPTYQGTFNFPPVEEGGFGEVTFPQGSGACDETDVMGTYTIRGEQEVVQNQYLPLTKNDDGSCSFMVDNDGACRDDGECVADWTGNEAGTGTPCDIPETGYPAYGDEEAIYICDDPDASNMGEEGGCTYICDDPEAFNTGEEGGCTYQGSENHLASQAAWYAAQGGGGGGGGGGWGGGGGGRGAMFGGGAGRRAMFGGGG